MDPPLLEGGEGMEGPPVPLLSPPVAAGVGAVEGWAGALVGDDPPSEGVDVAVLLLKVPA